jgi:hypothetical protein
MPDEPNLKLDSDRPVTYQIRVRGHLGPEWSDWFGGLTISPQDDGDTVLTGPVVDQAALYGVLKRVRDLGLTLLSVNGVEPGAANAPREE